VTRATASRCGADRSTVRRRPSTPTSPGTKSRTHTDDRETFLPIDAARRLVADGTLGRAGAAVPRGPRPTTSQQKTIGHDAPEILRRLREDGADAAILSAL